MTRCVFAIPGSLATPTGGYAYARKILPLLGVRMETEICALPSGFPFPTDAGLTEAARAMAAAAAKVTIAGPGILRGKRAMGSPAGEPLNLL